MKDVLKTIIQSKYHELTGLKKKYGALKNLPPRGPSFRNRFKKARRIRVIAEVKPSSPSEGRIFNPSKARLKNIIKLYDQFPLGAVSVLTDRKYFSGSYENLALAREITSRPLLCKEFIVDEYQIRLARYFGASAVLLIAEALPFPRLMDLYRYALSLGLDVLFEAHEKSRLLMLVRNKIPLIGINSRNLSTLELRPERSFRIKKIIPPGRTVIAESGLTVKEDMRKLARAGFHGALIGTSFLKSADPEKKLKEMVFYDS